MPTNANPRSPSIATARLVVFALMGGVALFTIVAAVVEIDRSEHGSMRTVLLMALAMTGVAALTCAVIVPRAIAARVAPRRDQALAEISAGNLPFELMTATLTAAALVEGFGLFGATVFLITRDVLALVAPVLSIMLLAGQLPTADGAREQVERAAARRS